MQAQLEVRRYRREAVTHSHDFHQLVLPLAGRLNMLVGGIQGCVSAESLALIAAGQAHRFTGSRGNAFLVVDTPPKSLLATDAIDVALWARAQLQPFVAVDAELLHLIRYLARATERGQLRGPLVRHACALLFGAIAVKLGVDEHGAWPPVLRTVSAYVDAHLEWPLSVADMARIGNVSVSRLHALFRQHLSSTPQKYLTQRRLRRAAELLEGTSLSVVEVAQRVGYSDQAAFTRAFRRHTGKAPLGYRGSSDF